jgi:DNA-binding MurR/RpiR family transcriptional regulator
MVTSVAGAGGASHAARQLFKLQPSDLLIVIAFPRYVTDTIELAQRARSHGGRVLALTDGPTSPLAPLADIALYAQAGNRLSANSDATVLALIEALCGAVAHRAERTVKAAAEMTEFLLPWLYGTPDAEPARGPAPIAQSTAQSTEPKTGARRGRSSNTRKS